MKVLPDFPSIRTPVYVFSLPIAPLPRTKGGAAVERTSSRGPPHEASLTVLPTRPKSSKKNEREGRGGIPGTARTRTPQSPYNNAGGIGRRHRLGNVTRGGETPAAGEAHEASAPFPAFDELSRWRVARGSVSRMLRQAGEVIKGRFLHVVTAVLDYIEECQAAEW